MEGIIVWIVLAVIWALIKGAFSSKDEIDDDQRKEIFDKLRLQLKVTEEIPPKDRGLQSEKHVAVKVKGLFGHPTEKKILQEFF